MMRRKSGLLFLGLLSLAMVLITGCDPAKRWEKEERQQIQSYLNSIGDTVYTLKPSGLYFLELTAGTGRTPVAKDTVSFRYKASLLDGRVFDSNLTATSPFTFVVGSGELILGIDEGIRLMKNGGKAKLITPSSLAYGPQGIYYVLAGYTPLLWQIEIVDVKAGPGK